MEVREPGRVMLVRLVQSEKAEFPMEVTGLPLMVSGTVMVPTVSSDTSVMVTVSWAVTV